MNSRLLLTALVSVVALGCSHGGQQPERASASRALGTTGGTTSTSGTGSVGPSEGSGTTGATTTDAAGALITENEIIERSVNDPTLENNLIPSARGSLTGSDEMISDSVSRTSRSATTTDSATGTATESASDSAMDSTSGSKTEEGATPTKTEKKASKKKVKKASKSGKATPSETHSTTTSPDIATPSTGGN